MPLQKQKKMIGRVYRWQHDVPGVPLSPYWRVLVAWEGKGPRNVLLEQLLPLSNGGVRGENWHSTVEWAPMEDGELGPLRVVDGFLYRATGFRTVRPFRGLRRVRP